MTDRPKLGGNAEKELDKVQEQFEAFDKNVQSLTLDRMNKTLIEESEPQTKIANRDIDKQNHIYLKPKKTVSSKEKFNERFREDYNFQKEYVHFIAENKEIIGEALDLWTKPFPGMPAENWVVPTNKPVWGPRYLAEQIARKTYHRLTMDQRVSTGGNSLGQFYGAVAVDTTIERLTARPVTNKRSIFMGETFK